MANTKPVSKKSTTKGRVNKAPVKRATTVRSKKATPNGEFDLSSGGQFKSFKVGKVQNFFSIRITDQTVYWAILSFIVLTLGIWVITIDDKVQRLYDQIDSQNLDDSVVVKKK